MIHEQEKLELLTQQIEVAGTLLENKLFDETSIYGTNENERILRRSLSEESAIAVASRVVSALRAYQVR